MTTTSAPSTTPPTPPAPATHTPIEIAPAAPLWKGSPNSRLSTSLEARCILSSSVAFASGMTLGLAHGSQTAGYRFRAENAHRLPQDATGWYLYHKSKNYHMMLGGVLEGLRMGAKLGVWVGGFFVCEEAVDRVRGLRGRRGDFGSTVVAGLGTAGAWSLWNRFPPITIARTARMGLTVGLGYGLLQDALSLAMGHKLGYVEWVRNLPSRLEERRQRKIREALQRRGLDPDDST